MGHIRTLTHKSNTRSIGPLPAQKNAEAFTRFGEAFTILGLIVGGVGALATGFADLLVFGEENKRT